MTKQRLTDLTLTEVSLVKRGANAGAEIILRKAGDAMDDNSDEKGRVKKMLDAIVKMVRGKTPEEIAKAYSDATEALTGEPGKLDLTDVTKEADMAEKEAALAAQVEALAKSNEEVVKALKEANETIEKMAVDGLPSYMQAVVKAMSPEERKKFLAMTEAEKASCMKEKMEKSDDPIQKALAASDERAKALEAKVAKMESDAQDSDVRKALEPFKADIADFGGTVSLYKSADQKGRDAMLANFKASGARVEKAAIFKEHGYAGVHHSAGDAYGELVKKAELLTGAIAKNADGSVMTKEQAFAKVWDDPANRALVLKHQSEARNA